MASDDGALQFSAMRIAKHDDNDFPPSCTFPRSPHEIMKCNLVDKNGTWEVEKLKL